MAENFYTIVTQIGLAKITNAQLTSEKLDLTTIVVGDGNGAYYNPASNATTVLREVWRGAIGSIDVDENNANWLVVDTVIPATVGGFTVREVGLLDVSGDLIAIGKYPETYKPVLADGSSKDLFIRMIIEVANTSVVTLKVDPAVVIASRKYVDDKFAQIGPISQTIEEVRNDLAAHKAESAKHNNYATSSTAASIAAKTATLSGFSLATGVEVAVKFTNANSASSPTLNVNSTGAKSIRVNGEAAGNGAWAAGEVIKFVYDGTYYNIVGKVAIVDSISSTSTTQAASANAVKKTWDTAFAKADPSDITSDRVNRIDRANITANTPPSGYPLGYSLFGENRVTETPVWVSALDETLYSGYRLLIETFIANTQSGPYQIHKQRVTYFTNTLSSPSVFRGIYERINKITDEGEVWGDFYPIMTGNGGNYKGIVKAYPNTSHTVAQIRNAKFSTVEPSVNDLAEGEICFVYEG